MKFWKILHLSVELQTPGFETDKSKTCEKALINQVETHPCKLFPIPGHKYDEKKEEFNWKNVIYYVFDMLIAMHNEESRERLFRITHDTECHIQQDTEDVKYVKDTNLWNNRMLVVKLALAVQQSAAIYAKYLCTVFERYDKDDKKELPKKQSVKYSLPFYESAVMYGIMDGLMEIIEKVGQKPDLYVSFSLIKKGCKFYDWGVLGSFLYMLPFYAEKIWDPKRDDEYRTDLKHTSYYADENQQFRINLHALKSYPTLYDKKSFKQVQKTTKGKKRKGKADKESKALA